ncbi:hypothetical protein HK405_008407, partial [Cladochytrium tenue]
MRGSEFVRATTEAILASKILAPASSSASENTDCICYGVGPPSTSKVSRFQLALFLLIVEMLQIKTVHVYDPVFDALDVAVIGLLGFQVFEHNEHGRRRATRPTLFFMPHCGDGLYSNLLRANWSPDALPRLVVLGNSFDAYAT